jgi:hypothetical protein
MEKQGENISGKHNIFNPKMLKRLGKRVTNNGRLVNNVNANANANANAKKSLKKANRVNTSRPSSPENPSENALGNPSPVAATPTGGSRSTRKSKKSRQRRRSSRK